MRRAEELGLQLEFNMVEVGGIPVGKDAAIRAWLEDLKQIHLPFFQLVCDRDMGKWDGYQLLRASGIPRLCHVLRNLPPHLAQDITVWFDGQVLAAFGHITNLNCLQEVEYDAEVPLSQPWEDWVKVGVTLPFRHGGLGLRSHRELIHTPFFAATAQVFHTLTQRVECVKAENDPRWFDNCWIGQAVHSSLTELRKVAHTEKLLPALATTERSATSSPKSKRPSRVPSKNRGAETGALATLRRAYERGRGDG